MKKYKVMLHEWKHYDKESLQKWTPAIKTTILNYPKEVTIKELAHALTNGQTVIFGNLEYTEKDLKDLKEGQKIGASSRHWKSQQLFALDFDNNDTDPEMYITAEEAIELSKKNGCPPAFVYTTYSHTKDRHRFRIVYAIDREITDFSERTQLLESLFSIFTVNRKSLVDTGCTDPARLFYPGKELIYTDYEAVIDFDKITQTIKPEVDKLIKVSTAKTGNKKRKYIKSENRVIDLLRKDKIDEAIKEIANNLTKAGKPYSTWVHEPLAKGGTVTISYIIKDYCPEFGQDPLKPVFIRDPDVYYDLVQHFPLHAMLGVRLNEFFQCLLPEHHDVVASARIEKRRDDNTYIYHCYGSNCLGAERFYDIFTFLEHAVGWSHKKAKEFINRLLNCEFETDWQKEKKEEISEQLDYIGSEHFPKQFPTLYKELKKANALGVYTYLLLEARRMIQDRLVTKTEDPVFFIGYREFQKKLEDAGFKYGISKSSLQRKIKYITKLGLLVPMDDKKLPSEFVARAHDLRTRKGFRYRLSFYQVPQFSLQLYANAEKIIHESKEIHLRRSYYTRQTELWANGKEEADRQYVQDKNVKKTKQTLKFYERYKAAALELLEKGYTTEKEILGHRRIRATKKKKELSATVLPQLLKELDLRIVKYSKYYKELFDIKQAGLHYGASNIIVRAKDVKDK